MLAMAYLGKEMNQNICLLIINLATGKETTRQKDTLSRIKSTTAYHLGEVGQLRPGHSVIAAIQERHHRRFEDARKDFDLLTSRGDGSNFPLKSRVGYRLDDEVQHEAFGEFLGQLVEKRAPRRMLDHFLQPRRRFTWRWGSGGEEVVRGRMQKEK